MRGENKITAFLAERRNAIVAGTRADGRPHATPNWFDWDGARFYVSTTRDRVKYRLFVRDPRAEFLIDDSTGFRYILTNGTVEVREDLAAELPHFRAIRVKYGRDVPASDDELLASLQAEQRVMLVYTPDRPIGEWTARGFD
ncbi:MAG TPA: TIGR03618 family F420-dependent PPOX class oxidoreductase [Streptosporangiaceae bacterium]|jgi:PPOX class probable F420-dependent enzyme|nr:TIGR03618 family F420-dependent PPOX class oxidoreductase [Streptosporangiaceae bacterium]